MKTDTELKTVFLFSGQGNHYRGMGETLFLDYSNKELKKLPANYFWKVISQPSNFCEFVKAMEKKGPCLYLSLIHI